MMILEIEIFNNINYQNKLVQANFQMGEVPRES